MKLLPVIAVLAVTASAGFATRVVCYYTNWSRFAKPAFQVEDIDAKLCTHVVYAFMGLDDDGSIKSVDPWNDFGDEWTPGALKRFLKLKTANPSVKLLVGVGGWNEGPLRFQSMVRNPEKRKAFSTSTIRFVRQHNLDGVEIDWIYHRDGGTKEDKEGLSLLVKEMKPRYDDAGYLLALSVSANPTIFDASYDIPALVKHLNFLNVMSYDFRGFWDGKTGHGSPLHAKRGDAPSLNVEAAIDKCLRLGAPPEKVNLALVGYGRSFTLVDPNKNGPDSPSRGPGKEEPLPYRNFCPADKKGLWRKFKIEEQKVSYAVAGDQWVGYEDDKSLKAKVNFGKSRKLGGVSFWSVDMDDYKGECGSGKYPLLKAVSEEISKK